MARWSDEQRAQERGLLERMASVEPNSLEWVESRNELVTLHAALVEHLARRFADRGERHEDLVQVGMIGLIKAADRFDPERGVEFSTYASPTIIGEIKRHFRDKGWAIRVPRQLQERRMVLSRAIEELTQTTGRSPTVRELAAATGLSEDDVLEGLESAQAYATVSLDAPNSDDQGSLQESLGFTDTDLEGVDDRESLKPLLAALAPREQRILQLRFFEGKTQSAIASELGISQMHVSRLLARTLAELRQGLAVETPA